jgi:hypothetical protein
MLLSSGNFNKALAIVGLSAVVAVQPTAFASANSNPSMRAPSPIIRSIGRVGSMTTAGPDARTPVLFIADDHTNAVYLFDANNLAAPPLAKITDGINRPSALAVDKSGVLYVASTHVVTAYRPGSLHPFRTIHAVSFPMVVAVSADGTLAMAGEPALTSPGTLAIFDKGSPTPTRIIQIGLNNEALLRVQSLAIDASDSVFLSVSRYPDGGQLLRFAPGSTNGIDTGITPGIGEAFDANGNFYVSYGAVINVWAPGAQQPFRRITNGLSAATRIAVSPDGRIFAPNIEQFNFGTNQAIPGNVVEYGQGPNPIAKLKSIFDVDPQATAVRPAFR